VARVLRERFVLAFHNQLPELYCGAGIDRYTREQIDRCPEGAGGGNVRCFVCTPSGKVVSLILGYWHPQTFLEELSATGHAEHIAQHRSRVATTPLSKAQQYVLIRGHEQALQDAGRPIAEVLRQIEDEIYTKGKIGCDLD
jgi:hypothetical protein